MKRLTIIAAFLLFSGLAVAYGYKCQYDNSSLYFTGQTKVEYGKLAKLYKCATGHRFWIVD